MKKIIVKVGMFVIVIAIMSSCSKYSVITILNDQNNGSSCPNPKYIATMSKTSLIITEGIEGGRPTVLFNQESLTLVSLLLDARKKYGEEVTIQNVRWDIKNGKKKTGVIYDVIKCK